MNTVKCNTCNTEYQEQKQKMIYRDVDEYNCDICGTKINSWNGAVTYSYTILKRGFRNGTVISGTFLFRLSDGQAVNTTIPIDPGLCKVISPQVSYYMLASQMIPNSSTKDFYKIEVSGNEFLVLFNFVELILKP